MMGNLADMLSFSGARQRLLCKRHQHRPDPKQLWLTGSKPMTRCMGCGQEMVYFNQQWL